MLLSVNFGLLTLWSTQRTTFQMRASSYCTLTTEGCGIVTIVPTSWRHWITTYHLHYNTICRWMWSSFSNRVSLSVKVSRVTVKVSIERNLFCAGCFSVELSASSDECGYSFYLGQGVSYGIRVTCLVSLAGAARSITFATKHIFCPNKSMFLATKRLSRQNTSFVLTKVCFLRQNVCRDKTHLLS